VVLVVLAAAAGIAFGTGLIGSSSSSPSAATAGPSTGGLAAPPAETTAPVVTTTAPPPPVRTTPPVPAGEASVSPSLIPKHGSGQFTIVPGSAPAREPGRVFRYRLEIEQGLPFNPADVARIAQQDLTDPRGWQPIEHVAFERVSAGPYDIRLLIATPGTTDKLCLPLDTAGELSCRNGNHVVLNALRWAIGIPGYAGHLADYHAYMFNHEVGHALGHHHEYCTHPGGPAPVMMQQTKGLGQCKPNPWPAVKG
jgi:hypothetical protein